MAIKSQKYRISWPLNEQQVENIDSQFEDLYRQLSVSILDIAGAASEFDDGDILYLDEDGNLGGLDIGLSGKLLQSDGDVPLWSAFTFPLSFTTGDLIYGSATNVLTALADVATGNALISGGVGVAPSWGKIALTTHVSGILPATNGGTGFSSYAVGDLLYASATTLLNKLADVATGNALISGGISTAPSWGKIGLTTHEERCT